MTRGVPRMNRNIAQLLKPAAIITITLFAAVSHAAPGGVSDGLKVWLRASTGIDAVDGGGQSGDEIAGIPKSVEFQAKWFFQH